MAAVRSRVLTREAAERLHGPAPGRAVTVSAVAASSVSARPSASGCVPKRNRRRASLPFNGPSVSWPPTSVCSLQGGWGHRASAQPVSDLVCDAEPSASQDLAELERCGLRVTWPRHPHSVADARAIGSQAAPCCSTDASPSHRLPQCELPPEVAEALRELDELEKSGFAVSRPR